MVSHPVGASVQHRRRDKPGGMSASPHHYRVTALLGEGAFGAVYLAEVEGAGLGRRVALKVLHEDRAATPGLLKRLRDEARMLSLIRHRAIIRVDDLVQLDGNWTVVMEYVEGCDVAALIALGPIPARPAVEIAAEMCAALHAAHAQEGPDGKPLALVHRDIKPSNIRLTAQGELKLLDFGVARAEFADREAATQNTGFGTIQYMSLERFEGHDTPAGDVYAVGITLFEMLVGSPPGKNAMSAERTPPGKKMRASWDGLRATDPGLHDLLASMLASEPGARPSAKAASRALSELAVKLGGDTLADWAEQVVPPLVSKPRPLDPAQASSMLVGQSVRGGGDEARASQPGAGPAPRAAGDRRGPESTGTVGLGLAAGGAMVLGLLGALAIVTLGAGAWWITRDGAATPGQPAGTPVAPAPPAAQASTSSAAPGGSAAQPPPTTPRVASPTVADAPSPPQDKGARGVGTPGATSATSPSPRPAKPAETAPVAVSPAASAQVGRLSVRGDARVTLSGAGGSHGPGEVPPGSYTASVKFPGGTSISLPNVSVREGATTVLTCNEAMANCSVKVE